MLVIVGLVIVIGSVLLGYTAHHGQLIVLWQWTEFVIIGGAGAGSLIMGNKPSVVKGVATQTIALLKPSPYGKEAFTELLQVLYEIFYAARKDGLVGIESHVEDPESSEIFSKHENFISNHHAVTFLADTLKVLLTGAVEDHHLAEILEMDLEKHHEEAEAVPHAIQTVGDAMPGFGIVAAVLGVIITMGKIGGAPEAIGKSVAAALVGTFIGILLAYGVFGPLASALTQRLAGEEQYMSVIRTALLSFARGDPPITSVEFARRSIEPENRPSFAELEELTRRRPAGG